MRIAASTRYLIGIVLTFILLAAYFVISSIKNVDHIKIEYDILNDKWKMEALSKDPSTDPRLDNDQISPVKSSDELIEVHHYKGDEGWQLAGGVIDIITHDGFKYILYGRQNLRFESYLWDNKIDDDRSFEDYFVIKRKGNQAEILVHSRLIPTTSQILIGLRRTCYVDGFEVIQNSTGYPQTIWLYQF